MAVYEWDGTLESNDSATQNTATNRITVDGQTGDGATDAYDVNGTVENISFASGEDSCTITWHGYEVDAGDTPLDVGWVPYTLDRSPDHPDSQQGVIFEIVAHEDSGDVQFDFDVSPAGGTLNAYRWENPDDSDIGTFNEDNVTAERNVAGASEYLEIEGQTGNGFGDSFDVVGEITAFGSIGSSDFDLYWGGELVTVDDLPLTPGDITVEAVDDAYTARRETQRDVAAPGVLENDTGAELAVTSASPTDGPFNGSLTLNADGSFSYTPDSSFDGQDSFEYEIEDTEGDTDTATVTITVGALDPTDDEYVTTIDTQLDVSAPGVLDNDEGFNPTVDGLESSTSNGSVNVDSDGSFTYTPTAGFSGRDEFVYNVSDDQGDSGQATAEIVVGDAPPDPDDYALVISGDTDSYQPEYSFEVNESP